MIYAANPETDQTFLGIHGKPPGQTEQAQMDITQWQGLSLEEQVTRG
jgi:hypothetical protein